MLMKDPKKNLATLIVGKMRPDETKPTTDGAEYDPSVGYKSAAEEILKAIEDKSPEALVEALKSFHEMCMNEPEEESQEPEQAPE